MKNRKVVGGYGDGDGDEERDERAETTEKEK